MDVIIFPLLELMRIVVLFYNWALIAYVIFHILIVGKVLDTSNKLIGNIYNFLHSTIEPFTSRLRKIIPSIKGFDLSLIVLFMISIYLKFFFEIIVMRYFPAQHIAAMTHNL